MKNIWFVLFLILLPSICLSALPTGTGWKELTNTALTDVCAYTHGYGSAGVPPDPYDVGGTAFCPALVGAYCGGVYDTTNNRMIIMGGGHADYAGNEIYLLNVGLSTPTLTTLNNPSEPNDVNGSCTTCNSQASCDTAATNSDNTPASRHTYDGMVYLPSQNQLMLIGGGMWCANGKIAYDTWVYDFNSSTWTNRSPTFSGFSATTMYGNESANGGLPHATLDPNTGDVYMLMASFVYKYNYTANTWYQIDAGTGPLGGTSVIDAKNKKLLMINSMVPRIYWWDIDTDADKCESVALQASCVKNTMTITFPTTSAGMPGLAWDSKRQKVVMWFGGNTVYVLNPDYTNNTGTWTPITFSGGPATSTDVYKRFQYDPTDDVFVAYTAYNANGYVLRLTNPKYPQLYGCTTDAVIDNDCDGYGPGSALGVDADDFDATIHTSAQTITKYTTIANYLAARGYPNSSVRYIATDGVDTGDCKTVGSPCISWAYVAALPIAAGDVVMFRAGTYYGNVGTTINESGINMGVLKGTSANPIVVMAYPGEKVIIDTTNLGINAAGTGHDVSLRPQYIILDGFTVQNSRAPTNGFAASIGFSDNISLKNLEIIGYNMAIFGGRDIQNLIVDSVNMTGTLEHAVYIGGDVTYPSVGALITRNLMHHTDMGGFGVFQVNGSSTTNLTFRENIMHTIGAHGISIINGLNNSVIDRNYVFNAGAKAFTFYDYLDAQNVIDPYTQTGNTISNNVFWSGKYNIYDGGGSIDCVNTTSGIQAVLYNQAATGPIWVSGTYAEGDWVFPSTPNGFGYMVKQGNNGASGESEPTWGEVAGGNTTDGAITWKAIPVPITLDTNTFRNNIFVTWNGPQFDFRQDDFWDTTTLAGNTFWNTGSGYILSLMRRFYTAAYPDPISWSVYSGKTFSTAVTETIISVINLATSGSYSQGANKDSLSNLNWVQDGSTLYFRDDAGTTAPLVSLGVTIHYNWSQFAAKNPTYWTSNTNADPGFAAASVDYCATPASFNFTQGATTRVMSTGGGNYSGQ